MVPRPPRGYIEMSNKSLPREVEQKRGKGPAASEVRRGKKRAMPMPRDWRASAKNPRGAHGNDGRPSAGLTRAGSGTGDRGQIVQLPDAAHSRWRDRRPTTL